MPTVMATHKVPRAGSWGILVAKCCRSAMNEASEFEVLQPPHSQETLLRKALRGVGGADHLKVTQWAGDGADSQPDFLTPRRPGPPSAPASSCTATPGLLFPVFVNPAACLPPQEGFWVTLDQQGSLIMANTYFTTYHNVINFHVFWASALLYFAFMASL